MFVILFWGENPQAVAIRIETYKSIAEVELGSFEGYRNTI